MKMETDPAFHAESLWYSLVLIYTHDGLNGGFGRIRIINEIQE